MTSQPTWLPCAVYHSMAARLGMWYLHSFRLVRSTCLMSLPCCSIWRQGSLQMAAYTARKAAHKACSRAGRAITTQPLSVDMASTIYMLNPGADLPATQAAFEASFSSQKTWHVSRSYYRYKSTMSDRSCPVACLVIPLEEEAYALWSADGNWAHLVAGQQW